MDDLHVGISHPELWSGECDAYVEDGTLTRVAVPRDTALGSRGRERASSFPSRIRNLTMRMWRKCRKGAERGRKRRPFVSDVSVLCYRPWKSSLGSASRKQNASCTKRDCRRAPRVVSFFRSRSYSYPDFAPGESSFSLSFCFER